MSAITRSQLDILKNNINPTSGRPLHEDPLINGRHVLHVMLDELSNAANANVNVSGTANVGEWITLENDLGAIIPLPQVGPGGTRAIPSYQPGMGVKAVQLLQPTINRFQADPIMRPMGNVLDRMASTIQAAEARALLAQDQQSLFLNLSANVVVPLCFDAVAPASFSQRITISSPYDQPWMLMALTANSSQCVGPRLTSFRLGNVEQLTFANLAYSVATPVGVGVDLANFAESNFGRANKSHLNFLPWMVKGSNMLSGTTQVSLEVYNPLAVAANINLTLYVRSSPCNDSIKDTQEAAGIYAQGTEKFKRAMATVLGNFQRNMFG